MGFAAVLVEDVIASEDSGFRHSLSLARIALRAATAKDIGLRTGDLSAGFVIRIYPAEDVRPSGCFCPISTRGVNTFKDIAS